MSARDENSVPLMTQEQRDNDLDKSEPMDIEASGRGESDKPPNLDHEYSIPSTIKFAWLGTYFLFSLALTIHNKLVLGSVSRSCHILVAHCGPLVPRKQLLAVSLAVSARAVAISFPNCDNC
jgi:hypothetical protein